MKKTVPARITHQAELPLTAFDRHFLLSSREKQLLFMIPVYCVVCIVCAIIGFGSHSSMDLNKVSFRINFGVSETVFYQNAVPYVCGLVFLASTVYIVVYCIQRLLPITKDLNYGKKSLLYFIPVRSVSAIPDVYYISTPLARDRQLIVSKDLYEGLEGNQELCVEVTAVSKRVIRLTKNGIELHYD